MEDRSPRFRIGQLASRTGVDPELLRKWESRYTLLAPQRSNGGFRLYSREDEQRVRLMQRHLARGYAAAEAAELAREGVVAPSPARLAPRLPAGVLRRSSRLLRKALDEFDEGAAHRALDDLFEAFTLDAVLRDGILPFLREIGDAWVRGQATPGQEHFASTIVEARLLSLTRGWSTGSGRRALLACPSGERHTLGLLVFGITLARRGWRITYLGADTPVPSLAHAAAKVDPAIVVLATSRPRWLSRDAEALASIAAGRRLAIGGAGATNALADRLEAEHLTTDPVTAATDIAAQKRIDPPGAGR